MKGGNRPIHRQPERISTLLLIRTYETKQIRASIGLQKSLDSYVRISKQLLILRITRHFAICELLGKRFICLLPIWPQQLLTLGMLNMLEKSRYMAEMLRDVEKDPSLGNSDYRIRPPS